MKFWINFNYPNKKWKESLPVFLKELKKYRYKILIVVDPKDPHKYKIKKIDWFQLKNKKT